MDMCECVKPIVRTTKPSQVKAMVYSHVHVWVCGERKKTCMSKLFTEFRIDLFTDMSNLT